MELIWARVILSVFFSSVQENEQPLHRDWGSEFSPEASIQK